MHNLKIEIKTGKPFDILDMTEKVEDFLKKISAKDGLVNIFTRHTTVGIKINEKEAGFFKDLQRIVTEKIASPDEEYHHNDMENRDPSTICPISGGEECKNGHSHVAQMFLGSASETVPVVDGKMLLGKWQRILMFELDHGKNREVIFTFSGDCN